VGRPRSRCWVSRIGLGLQVSVRSRSLRGTADRSGPIVAALAALGAVVPLCGFLLVRWWASASLNMSQAVRRTRPSWRNPSVLCL